MTIASISSLTEVTSKLREVCFTILSTLHPDSWKELKQVVYSSVDDWDTAYSEYLKQTQRNDVKFPFATLTREASQTTTKLWNNTFIAHEAPSNGNNSVPSVHIKPVNLTFNLSIYEKELGNLETIADIIIVQGDDIQRLDFFSEVFQQPSRISFIFLEPEHKMIPDKTEKQGGKGFIYGMTIPIQMQTVLGVREEEKLITEIINKLIIDNVIEETTIINSEDC